MQDETDLTSTYFIEDVIIIVPTYTISTIYGTVYNIHITMSVPFQFSESLLRVNSMLSVVPVIKKKKNSLILS